MIKQMFVKVQINPEQSCIHFGHNRGSSQENSRNLGSSVSSRWRNSQQSSLSLWFHVSAGHWVSTHKLLLTLYVSYV